MGEKDSGNKSDRKIGSATLGLIMERDREADKRVDAANKEALEAVKDVSKSAIEAQERASARNWRLTMALVAVLGAVAMGATALKLGGFLEIGSSESTVEGVVTVPDPIPNPAPNAEPLEYAPMDGEVLPGIEPVEDEPDLLDALQNGLPVDPDSGAVAQ